MSIRIEHCTDVAVITPILKTLRDALPGDLFGVRLSRAFQDGYRVLIAWDANTALGCLGYRLSNDVYWGKTLFIDDLVVLERARGTGIGGQLLGVAKNEARRHSCDHVRLCSGLSRAQAHRFYEQNGFARTSLQFFQALHDGED